MAQDFLTIPVFDYVGIPYLKPAPFHGKDQFINVVPLFIDWAVYGASSTNNKLGVQANFATGVTAQLVPKFVSVYIDNLGSNIPAYCLFPSTGFVVVAPPNSADWYNVIATDLKVIMYGLGFVTGQIPKTNFFFTDAYVPPYSNYEQQNVIDKWLASASISRGATIFNQDYGVPALGDQTDNKNLAATGLGSATLFNSPILAGGFIYITDIFVGIANYNGANTAVAAGILVIESTGLSGNLYTFYFMSTAGSFTIYEGKGNVKLNALETWRIRIVQSINSAGYQGTIYSAINYTTNPN